MKGILRANQRCDKNVVFSIFKGGIEWTKISEILDVGMVVHEKST